MYYISVEKAGDNELVQYYGADFFLEGFRRCVYSKIHNLVFYVPVGTVGMVGGGRPAGGKHGADAQHRECPEAAPRLRPQQGAEAEAEVNGWYRFP